MNKIDKSILSAFIGMMILLGILGIAGIGLKFERFRIQSCMKSLNNIEYCLK